MVFSSKYVFISVIKILILTAVPETSANLYKTYRNLNHFKLLFHFYSFLKTPSCVSDTGFH